MCRGKNTRLGDRLEHQLCNVVGGVTVNKPSEVLEPHTFHVKWKEYLVYC